MEDNKVKDFMNKVKAMEQGQKLDLSSGEDLSIGIMNLISIEEHLFFSGGKTGATKYFELLNEVRKMRVDLMKSMIKEYEGEVWCISKHLLAASMRVMEVGTKALKNNEKEKANELFKKSYELYNMCWALNLGLMEGKDLKKIEIPEKEKPMIKEEKTVFAKMGALVGKALDCCRE
ncbi:MAG: hypothetical protein NTV98_03185 [Candidatus Roizmanbacteria bacterium]|nr:hypothetical protein [Candidatus Roizmanbacteria bacterium]